jgi:hypothetical protein
MIEVKPENLMGGRSDDNDRLDEELRRGGIDVIATLRFSRTKTST